VPSSLFYAEIFEKTCQRVKSLSWKFVKSIHYIPWRKTKSSGARASGACIALVLLVTTVGGGLAVKPMTRGKQKSVGGVEVNR
jgi:hypothetical protein